MTIKHMEVFHLLENSGTTFVSTILEQNLFSLLN